MNTKESSSIEVVASSGIFQIEFFHETGAADYNRLIEISNSLEKDFGKKFVLSHKTIEKYFNHSGSLPYVARYRNEIIGLNSSLLRVNFTLKLINSRITVVLLHFLFSLLSCCTATTLCYA